MTMNLVDDVKVELAQGQGEIHLFLISAAGRAVAILTPGQAEAIAAELLEMAAEIGDNPGGTLN
jgi:hypothetical protein